MGVFGTGLFVAAAADVSESGGLVPPVYVGRTLFGAAALLVEFDAYEVVLHVAVEDAVDVFSAPCALLLILRGLIAAATVWGLGVFRLAVDGVRLWRLLVS